MQDATTLSQRGTEAPQIHLPDPELLDVLRSCVPEQGISSMAEAQTLLLCNFRVGSSEPNACEQWLTEVTRDLFKPIPSGKFCHSCPLPAPADLCRRSQTGLQALVQSSHQ